MTREECELSIVYLEGIKDNYIEGNGYERYPLPEYYAIETAIKALEQEPKTGHWILTDVEGYRVWHCNCSECGKDPQDYTGGSEDWWLIKSKLPNFCPNCGSDNRER